MRLVTLLLLVGSQLTAVRAEELEPVVVEAKAPSADEIDAEYQTGFVKVIKREQFDSKVATVADVLKNETGVQVRQSGGLGSYSAVYLRGSTSKQVNVYLDGVLLNDATGGSVDLSQILLSGIEQIEIYKGATPIQLGYSGVGGAINIKSLRFSKPLRQLSLGYGSFNSRKGALTFADSVGETNYLASLDYLGSDNDFEMLNDNQTEFNPYDDRVERRRNADFSQFNGMLMAERSLSDRTDLQLMAQHFNKDQHLPDIANLESTRTSLDTDFTRLQSKLSFARNAQENYSGRIFWSTQEERYDDSQSRIGLGVQKTRADTDVVGAELYGSYSIGLHLLSATLEARRETYQEEDLTGRSQKQEFERMTYLLGVQDEWADVEDIWLVRLSARQYFLKDETPAASLSGRTEEATDSAQYHSLQAGVRYRLTDWLSLKTNASRDVRFPQLAEKFGDRGFFIGNSELQPETALNGDIGFEVGVDSFSVSAAYFYRDLKDAIVPSYDSRGVGRFENVGKARVSGVEVDAMYRPVPAWTFIARSTAQDTENLSDARDLHGKQLAGAYTYSHFLSAAWNIGRITTSVEYRHESGAYYDSAQETEVEDQNIVDVVGRWSDGETTVEVSANNVTDEVVEAFNGFPSPGRHYFVTLQHLF
ncbi:TonB-dependent receptor [Hahella aquimaris]|uniref:TonB-dependent receptor plug domain-containing protein n=1 Tax=Hahella sp. HNIBRBA332 TaxID=3015983 RepID=UPI00273BB115|nr:TonB-dependent receptor [Hahella sp. HNIBRBA332]WLQ12290.1 TonB-dependent receptor [Hahella sp. HNIBRBA332]